jgi:undecaprenyl-diphosphatase
MKRTIWCTSTAVALAASLAQAGGFDHRLGYDNSGIWSHSVQQTMQNAMIVGVVAGSVWEGGETRFGHTLWQSVDSTIAGALISEAGKHVFTRARPSQTDDPSQWFQGSGHYSFPSTEVTTVMSIVTPVMLEYGHDYPATYALGLLPVYTGVARMKEWGHWQTDVLASLALGGATGYWAHSRQSPLLLSVMPHEIVVGVHKSF